jgi:hypothetical protein
MQADENRVMPERMPDTPDPHVRALVAEKDLEERP